MSWHRSLFSSMLIATLTGCATTPAIIRTPIEGPSVAIAINSPDVVQGKLIRWGGTVLTIENKQSETWVQVMAKHLQRNGRPLAANRSQGRFFARVAGFLDPEVYQNGRELTVVGRIAGSVTENIGNFPYRFPVVQVEALHLWEQIPDYEPYYYPPYYWDPFYYPWWPHGYYPRYPYYRHRHH